MNIKKSIKEMTGWGVKEDQKVYLQKKIILTNEICLLVIFIIVFSAFIFFWVDDRAIAITHAGILITVILTLLFNKLYLVHFSRFFISFLPVGILLSSAYFSKHTIGINYMVFSYAIIGLSLIPILIFNVIDEKKYFISALGYHLLFLILYDRFLMVLEGSNQLPSLIDDHYLYFKAIQIQLWFFIVISIMFVKRINRRFENRFTKLNTELEESNKEIQAQNEEIMAQNEEIASTNEELTQQQEQIVEQRNYIESQNSELRDYQNKLLDYIYELSKTNSKLSKKQAENKSILSALRLNFIMMEFDLQGRVSWVTAKTCEYLGIGKSELIGKHGKDILTVMPNGSAKNISFEILWEKVLSSEAVNVDFDLNVADRDLSISATLAPIMDENGESIKILTIAEDISSIVTQHKIIESKNALLERQQEEIQDRNEELRQQKEEIEAINETLEQRVKERTMVLEQKNRQLAEYAFINAHLLRAPVSSILGLINLMGMEKLNTRELELYKYLKESANQLDKIVFKINRAIEMNREFDREFLRE